MYLKKIFWNLINSSWHSFTREEFRINSERWIIDALFVMSGESFEFIELTTASKYSLRSPLLRR